MATSKRRAAPPREHTGGRRQLGDAAARPRSIKLAPEMDDAIAHRAAAEPIAVSDWVRRALDIALAIPPADLAAAKDLGLRQGLALRDVVREAVQLAIARGSTR